MSPVSPSVVPHIKAMIALKRDELMKSWTPEKCPEEHIEGWLAWQYASSRLLEEGAEQDQVDMILEVWQMKARRLGTYNAIAEMFATTIVVAL